MSQSVWEDIEDLFESEGLDYALRYAGMPNTGNKSFEAKVARYKKLAQDIEVFVAVRASKARDRREGEE